MIRRGIKNHRVSCRKSVPGWIGFMNMGWVDTLRVFDESPGLYSWWSQRFPSVRLQNKGWRIDYINVTEPLRKKSKSRSHFSGCET